MNLITQVVYLVYCVHKSEEFELVDHCAHKLLFVTYSSLSIMANATHHNLYLQMTYKTIWKVYVEKIPDQHCSFQQLQSKSIWEVDTKCCLINQF